MTQGAVMCPDDARVTTPEKFWARVDQTDPAGCWPWLGRLDEKGYGRIGFNRKQNQPTHRIAWTLTNEQVRQLRAEYARGSTSQQALADRYGISRGNLSKILNRKAYVDA